MGVFRGDAFFSWGVGGCRLPHSRLPSTIAATFLFFILGVSNVRFPFKQDTRSQKMETTGVGRRSQSPEALATPLLWASVTEGLCVQSALDLLG